MGKDESLPIIIRKAYPSIDDSLHNLYQDFFKIIQMS